jgi:hypothetical protein
MTCASASNDRPENHGGGLDGENDHLLPEAETGLVARAFSLEGEKRLRAGEMQGPLEPHSFELLRPTVTLRCWGVDMDSGVRNTGKTTGA